jgi:phosphotransacetylase
MNPDLIKIMEKSIKKKAKIVVCEGWDDRCIKAAEKIKGLAEVKLLDKEFINSDIKTELAAKLFEVRKHKGMTIEQAKELMKDENYFGVMYAYCGYADAVGGSAVCSTASLMRPALQVLRKGYVSEVSVMNVPKIDHVVFASDCSLGVNPTAEDLSNITLNAAECVEEFGIEPRIAIVSYSTKGSGGKSKEIQLILDTLDIVKSKRPELLVDGELQFDAAVNNEAAKKKAPDSPLEGNANTIIFPNLTASNIFCHGLIQYSDARFEFTVMKGLDKPVAIFGRSSDEQTIYYMLLSLAMQVNKK